MNLLRKKQHKRNRRNTLTHGEGRGAPSDTAGRYAFRRNRTLTGSLSSSVASANEHHSELRSARVQTHHLRRHRRRLVLALLGAICVVAGLTWLIWQSVVSVQVTVNNGASIPADTKPYTDEIQSYLTSYPFEHNRVTLNTGNLTTYVQNHGFPEVKQIELDPVHKQIGSATMIITMRRPVVSWKTGSTRLYVAGDGVAFQRNYYPDPTTEVIDQTGIQAVNNQVLASNRFLGFIGLVIGHLHTQGYSVSKVILPADTTHQLLVSIQGVGYPVKFSIDRPAADQAEDAARSIRYLASKGISPSYLDVRVSGRAYYK